MPPDQIEPIAVELDEDPQIPIETSPEARAVIDKIINLGEEATRIRKAKEAAKIAAIRELYDVTICLMENPGGLTTGELLAASDSTSLISLIGRLRAYLKTHNLYTLKKRKRDGQAVYYLDLIR